MKKLVTLQGKNFKLSDIALYKVVQNSEGQANIIAYIYNPEQTEKYRRTKSIMDAPIWIDEYTKETELTILNGMKHIMGCMKVDATGEGEVVYETGERQRFDSALYDEINDNLAKQRNLDKYKVSKEKEANMSESDKENAKQETKSKVNRGIAGIVATALVAGALGGGIVSYAASHLINKNTDEEADLTNTPAVTATFTPTPTATPMITATPEPTPSILDTHSFDITNREEIKAQAEKLCATVNNNAHVLTYQQDAKLNIDEDLATEIVEVLNEITPSSLENLDGREYENEMGRILTTIEAISWSDTRSAIDGYEPINLHSYIANNEERNLVESAVKVAKEYLHSTIGAGWNGSILSGTEEATHAFYGFANELLEQELVILGSDTYENSSNISKFLMSTVYRSTNSAMPLWINIKVEDSEYYGMYYLDTETRIAYYPEEDKKTGEAVYVHTYEKDGTPYKEIYTLNEMEEWASENSNIVPVGVFTNVDIANETLRAQILTAEEKSKTY